MIVIPRMTERAISICVTFFYLLSIQQISGDKESGSDCNPYPEGLQGKFTGEDVSHNRKTQHQLTYIITILGEVVYLFLVHHPISMSNVYAIDWLRYNQLISYRLF